MFPAATNEPFKKRHFNHAGKLFTEQLPDVVVLSVHCCIVFSLMSTFLFKLRNEFRTKSSQTVVGAVWESESTTKKKKKKRIKIRQLTHINIGKNKLKKANHLQKGKEKATTMTIMQQKQENHRKVSKTGWHCFGIYLKNLPHKQSIGFSVAIAAKESEKAIKKKKPKDLQAVSVVQQACSRKMSPRHDMGYFPLA